MIKGSDALLAASQIAIGLAGFSGVVAAFSRTRDFVYLVLIRPASSGPDNTE